MDRNQFVAPKPKGWVRNTTSVVNRIFILGGIPGLNRIPGFRPVTRITKIDFPASEREKLRGCVGPHKSVFFTPNHPEFFTDWMLDKYVLDKVAPTAASWATHQIVNGTGRLMQRFWLANNLIAQIPGQGGPAKEHSIYWASQGHGVLLHPEGRVGWHSEHIGDLFPGAIEMASKAAELSHVQKSYVAPILWKLFFTKDVSRSLLSEYVYITKRLGIDTKPMTEPALAVKYLYDTLLQQHWAAWSREPYPNTEHFSEVWETLVHETKHFLASHHHIKSDDPVLITLLARRAQRKIKVSDPRAKLATSTLEKLLRLGPWMWKSKLISQEEVAEHLKRIRADYCTGSMRDTRNSFVPIAAGNRIALIRAVEPLAIDNVDASVSDLTDELQIRMQKRLRTLVSEGYEQVEYRFTTNPFFN